MTIMALITGVAFTGFNIGIDSWQRGSEKIAELDQRFAIERLIQRQVSLADPALFRGSSSEVELISTYSLADGPGDPVQVKYLFSSNSLVYTEVPVGYRSGSPTSDAREVLNNISRLEFTYLTNDDAGRPIWRQTWSEESLPLAVNVRVEEDVLTVPLVNRR
jgi:hypothetical protein